MAGSTDPRLAFADSLLDLVNDGYYAVEEAEGEKINFLYISRPNKGNYKDTIKMSTQHGPRWSPALVRYPGDGGWEVHDREAVNYLMLVIADPVGCLLRYGCLGHCCKCNTELTDMRSRHYGIGPECEKKAGSSYIIDLVDQANDGKSWEQLEIERTQ